MCTWNIVNVCVRRAGPSQQRKTPLPVSCNFLVFWVWGGHNIQKGAAIFYIPFFSLSRAGQRVQSPPPGRPLSEHFLHDFASSSDSQKKMKKKDKRTQKILFYFSFLKEKKVVCLLLLLLLSCTDNVPGSLSRVCVWWWALGVDGQVRRRIATKQCRFFSFYF